MQDTSKSPKFQNVILKFSFWTTTLHKNSTLKQVCLKEWIVPGIMFNKNIYKYNAKNTWKVTDNAKRWAMTLQDYTNQATCTVHSLLYNNGLHVYSIGQVRLLLHKNKVKISFKRSRVRELVRFFFTFSRYSTPLSASFISLNHKLIADLCQIFK